MERRDLENQARSKGQPGRYWAFVFPHRLARCRTLLYTLGAVAMLYSLLFSLYLLLNTPFGFGFGSVASRVDRTLYLNSSEYLEYKRTYHFYPELGLDRLRTDKQKYLFEWSHWVNMSDLYRHESDNTPFRWNPQVEASNFNKPLGRGTVYELKRLGMSYLARHAAGPDKIVIIEEDSPNSTSVYVLKPPPGADKTMFKVYSEIESQGLLPPFNVNLTASVPVSHRLTIDPSPDMLSALLRVDFNAHARLRNSIEHHHHSSMVSHALATIRRSPKFFHEPVVINNRLGGVHYDWRFFNKMRPQGSDLSAPLHHLIRTWADFARREGIMWWLAHGALIGWYWNGLALTWDSDMDIQMPIAELDRIARRYNNTLVIQNPADGDGRFLIEVSPSYVQRVKGNGRNKIDARFIDIRTGMFIDITALSHIAHPSNKNYGPNTIGCKAPHYYAPSDIFPLRLSMFEGTPVYIPHDVDFVLTDEYHGYRNASFEDKYFNQDMRLWASNSLCANFTDASRIYDSKTGELSLYGACGDEELWSWYKTTKDVTELRAKEASLVRYLGAEQRLDDDGHEVGKERGKGKLQIARIMEENAEKFAKYITHSPPLLPSPQYLGEEESDFV